MADVKYNAAAPAAPGPHHIDVASLEIARQHTADNDPQRRAALQVAITDAIQRYSRPAAPAPEPARTITCNKCGIRLHEDDLVRATCTEDGEACDACPKCGTDHYLMDAPPAPVAASAPNPWREAVDEQMVVHHIGVADEGDDPRECLRKLLEINATMALDPAISQAARDLAASAVAWRPIHTAPEDTHVILATSGGFVGEALMLRNEDTGQQKWTWALGPVHHSHTPLGWMPMPSSIDQPVGG